MLSKIFVDRPIFAWVIAIVVMLAGVIAISQLPVEQYPNVAPPQITIRTSYPGASAETIQNSVTQVIEQSLVGIDNLLYFSASSSSRGRVTLNVTFSNGVDSDIAQVQVQNQVQQVLSRLPQEVQQQGVEVRKANPDSLLIVGVYDETDTMTNIDVADYVTSSLQDVLGRVPGVGDTDVYGTQYAMRVWLDPIKLRSFQLVPADVIAAIRSQNAEVAAGQIGAQPQPAGQMLNALVSAQSRLRTPEQFRGIILKTQSSGSAVRLGDVARIELGAENYDALARINRHPSAGISIMLSQSADALTTAELVKAEAQRVARDFPPGLKLVFANDSTRFIELSINEVVKTLLEAIALVVLVIFLFLRSWRAAFIPGVAVPVVLLGTFAVLWLAGFSINTMTLFALVLSIGLLVDDAIVVVENVERIMAENPGITPREATLRSMSEIGMALVAIALVLSAVFVPMAFFGGSTGVIYRQFSLTIVTAMVLSVFVALILSPALTTTLLKSHRPTLPPVQAGNGALSRYRSAMGEQAARVSTAVLAWFLRAVRAVIAWRWLAIGLYLLITAGFLWLFLRLPSGFLPAEDQGRVMLQYRLPGGATLGRTAEVQNQLDEYLLTAEAKNAETVFSVSGGGATGGQNTGMGFVSLADWAQRQNERDGAESIVKRISGEFAGYQDARVFALLPAPIRGLGDTGGFTFELLNSSGLSAQAFREARDRLLAAAQADPGLSAVRPVDLPDIATLQVNSDPLKLSVLGLGQQSVNDTLSAAWGGVYVNDFVDRGRVKRVYVQGDAQWRDDPQALAQWYVRGEQGQMTSLAAFTTTAWAQSPTSLSRFNGVPAYEIQGQAAAGFSSGEAMDRMEALAREIPGVSVAWSGLSYQERLSSGQATLLYGLSILVVFLCLAALYESWSVPLSVLMVIPLGLFGAVTAVTLRGLINDVYLQIGLLTTMGLAAKNAILVVEFAEQAERKGMSVTDAALEATRLRIRPIMMTSIAFILGVLPMAFSSGAGAESRIAIGTAVIGGMLAATALIVFYIPLFFILIRQAARWPGMFRRGDVRGKRNVRCEG